MSDKNGPKKIKWQSKRCLKQQLTLLQLEHSRAERFITDLLKHRAEQRAENEKLGKKIKELERHIEALVSDPC